MEETCSFGLLVGLDIAEQQHLTDVEHLLKFAQIPTTKDLDTANVVLGDGTHSANCSGYVYVSEYCQPPAQSLCTTLHLNPLLATLTRAFGMVQFADHFVEGDNVFAQYVGTSEAAVATRQLIASAAHKDVTVLITGESGTGKEVVARALHQGSRRATGPFVPVNCGAIPADLLESELFGHDKGAFTGAITQKTGRLELAHGGTLFLDEIGDLPFSMQVKLLRAIEQKSFERLGSGITRVSDIRIVAATNNDLEAKIADGEFREDLFYRLNVFPIELSPLRERSEDLPLLINTLVARIHAEQALQVRLSVDALNLLAEYAWPGNVRELANLLQRLAIQYPNGLVRSIDLPKKYTESADTRTPAKARQSSQNLTALDILLPVNGIDLKDYLARLEKSLIEQALQDTNAVVARAADRLHIRRTTLVEKMRKHGLGRNLDVVQ